MLEQQQQLYKSGYIISVIDKDIFINIGATQLTTIPDAYYIKKKYTGEPHFEVCALIGIRIENWYDLLTDDSQLIRKLRECPDLNYILDIGNITCGYITEILYKFKNRFKSFNENDLLILNIEPKGTGYLEKKYPKTRLCIPGGTMEQKELNSYKYCAFREFEEETGIILNNLYIIIFEEQFFNRKYGKKNKKYSYYKTFYNKEEEKLTHVSVVFLIHILSENDKTLYDLELGLIPHLGPLPGMYFI